LYFTHFPQAAQNIVLPDQWSQWKNQSNNVD